MRSAPLEKFVDFSKTEEGKKIFEKNKELWTNGNFLEHVKTLKDPQEIEMAQIIRKYQSSFMWIHKEVDNLKAFQIRHTPTCKPADLPKEIELSEGYLWLEVIVPNKYPIETASFVILNHSVEKDIKRLVDKQLFDYHIECRSLLKTLKFMDNNLDILFEKAVFLKSQPPPVEKPVLVVERKQPPPVKETAPVVTNQKPQEKTKEKVKEKEKEKVKEKVKEKEKEKPKEKEKEPFTVASSSWSQEEQKKLEKAIVEFKDIKDAKEKWTKIGERVGKTMSECVQRFKDCRKAAEEKKNNPPEEQKVSDVKKDTEEEEESNEDEGEDEEGSSDEEGHTSDENNEEQKENRKIRDYQEYESCLESVVLAKNMRFENVSVGSLISIQIQVSCKDCKCIHETEAHKEPDSEYLVNNDKCPRCGQKSRLVAKQEIFHDSSNAVCSLGSFTWDVRDFHFCEFDLTCEFCDTANRTKKIIAGQPVYMECKGCFKKMTFSYMALTLAALALGQGGEEEEEGNGPSVQDIMKKIFARKTKFEFKVGLPLPNNGSCKHYKGSNRYFRFPCCGKCYACDDCHSKVEKHEMMLAKNMICGWCSSEQPVGDICKRCAKAVTKIVRKTAYWEGGKGTRNVAAMSRKDPHKFRGIGKTVSSKKKNKMKS